MLFMSSYAARTSSTARFSMADRRRTGRTRAQRFWMTIPLPIECMSKGNFQFGRLRPIFGSAGPAEHTRSPPQQLKQWLKALWRVTVPRVGSKGAPMKLPRTVGLAVAASLLATTVAALAEISGAAPNDPTANACQAD